jgi:putative addiction module killer protein
MVLTVGYTTRLEIVKSATLDAWLSGLRDRQARAKVQARITRLALGNPGDVEPAGSGISEMRIHYGPGYRVYYLQCRPCEIVLLCGGTKATQQSDIERAHEIANDWKERRI